MKSLSRNSSWSSKVYDQEVADGNWRLVTPSVDAKHVKIELDPASTSTQLITHQNVDLQGGDRLLVKLSDNNYYEIDVDGISSGNSNINDFSYNVVYGQQAFRAYYVASSYYRAGEYSPDGTKGWLVSSDGYLKEFICQEPFSGENSYLSGNVLNINSVVGAGRGFFWSNNGVHLYTSGVEFEIKHYICRTPFDISTAVLAESKVGTSTTMPSYFMHGAISDDGLNIMFLVNGGSTTPHSIDYRTLLYPWNINEITGVADYGTNLTGTTNVYSITVSGDGSKILALYDDGNSGSLLFSINPPYGGTVASTTVLTGISEWITSTNNNNSSRYVTSRDFSHITMAPYGNNVGDGRMINVTTKFNTPTLIDISSASLTEAPIEAIIINSPKVIISANPSSVKVNTEKEPLWLEYSTVTTSSATVGHIDSGRISIGDKIILNGTTEVEVTGVTETPNALSYIGLGEPEGNKYLGSGTTVGASATVASGSSSSIYYDGMGNKMTFSPDGRKLFVVAGPRADLTFGELRCYNLLVPWDITTIEEDARGPVSLLTFGQSSLTTDRSSWNGLQFRPDGKRIFLFYGRHYALQADLESAWDPYTVTQTYSSVGPWVANETSTWYNWRDAYITNDGSTVVASAIMSTNTYAQRYYFSLSSAWDLSNSWPTSGVALPTGFGRYYLIRNNTLTDTADTSYRGVVERSNSDGTLVFTCGSGGTGNGFGNGAIKTFKDYQFSDFNQTSTAWMNWTGDTLDNRPNAVATDMYISPNGTRMYILSIDGVVRCWQCRAETLNKYEITFAAQPTVPNKISLPEVVSTTLNLTPTVDSVSTRFANLTWDGESGSIDGRGMQAKIIDFPPETEINNIRLDLQNDI